MAIEGTGDVRVPELRPIGVAIGILLVLTGGFTVVAGVLGGTGAEEVISVVVGPVLAVAGVLAVLAVRRLRLEVTEDGVVVHNWRTSVAVPWDEIDRFELGAWGRLRGPEIEITVYAIRRMWPFADLAQAEVDRRNTLVRRARRRT